MSKKEEKKEGGGGGGGGNGGHGRNQFPLLLLSSLSHSLLHLRFSFPLPGTTQLKHGLEGFLTRHLALNKQTSNQTLLIGESPKYYSSNLHYFDSGTGIFFSPPYSVCPLLFSFPPSLPFSAH